MERRLKRNVCNLDDYASLSEVKDLPAHCGAQIGDALSYACQVWKKHLAELPSSSNSVDQVHKAIDRLFETCLLYWIEVLSHTRNLDISIYAINDVHQWYILVSCT